jgi:hypothetical protein
MAKKDGPSVSEVDHDATVPTNAGDESVMGTIAGDGYDDAADEGDNAAKDGQ